MARMIVEPNCFLAPNECNPARLMENYLFQQAPCGAYVTVGTERGWIGAAIQEKIDCLILADRNPAVNLYNWINCLILATSNNIVDYRHLRLEADFEKLQKRISDFTKDHFEFWTKHARPNSENFTPPRYTETGNYDFGCFDTDKMAIAMFALNTRAKPQTLRKFLGKNPSIIHPHALRKPFFEGKVNYLFEEALYLRLKSLAVRRRVFIKTTNIESTSDIYSLANLLQEHNLIISMLDLSNLGDGAALGYPTTSQIIDFVRVLYKNKLFAKNSVVIETDFGCASTQLGDLCNYMVQYAKSQWVPAPRLKTGNSITDPIWSVLVSSYKTKLNSRNH